MEDFSDRIYRYFLNHYPELSIEQQFHFANRLYLWSQEAEAKRLLDNLRPQITSNGNVLAAIHQVIEDRKETKSAKNDLAQRRSPYFKKYPLQRTCLAALFRIMILKTVYSIDAKQHFYECFDKKTVEFYRIMLLDDSQAIRIFSTHAVNFLYLYQIVIKQEHTESIATRIFKIGQEGYNQNDPIELKLLMYLYTHCIIGESLFYYRNVESNRAVYDEMIGYLERIIEKHFKKISLDNKLEFLVCAKILGFDSAHTSAIFDEARMSLASHGTYLVDKYNVHTKSTPISLGASEHRNTLFLMACRPFRPLT